MPRKTLDIIAALRQKSLLGPAVGDLSSRGAWLVFLKALYGLPLDDAELATFRKHTGRDDPRPGGYAEGSGHRGPAVRKDGDGCVAGALRGGSRGPGRAVRSDHSPSWLRTAGRPSVPSWGTCAAPSRSRPP